MALSPEILKGDSPLFEQDEATGEQTEISNKFLKQVAVAHHPLLRTLFDMDAGLIHLSMSEYDGLSYKFMEAWRLFKSTKADKIASEKNHDK